MFDLTHATWRPNRYGGSEKKRTLLFDGKIYMVKFPEPPRSKKVLSATLAISFPNISVAKSFKFYRFPHKIHS